MPRAALSCGMWRGWSCGIVGTERVCALGSGGGRVTTGEGTRSVHVSWGEPLEGLGRAPQEPGGGTGESSLLAGDLLCCLQWSQKKGSFNEETNVL